MDEFNNDDLTQNVEDEISITDKMVGVLTEPSGLFQKLSHQKPKVLDWVLPIILIIIFASLSRFVMMSNPEIKADAIEKQMTMMEKNIQEAVDKGNLSQEKADEILEKTRESMEKGGTSQLVMAAVGIAIFSFIIFFIITGIFYLVAKITLGGTGTYSDAMVAYGLPFYILVIQIIVMIIVSMAMNKMFIDTSVGSFLGMENNTLIGLLAHKLDIFSIWFYAVVSIAFAKMFKSENTTKYLITFFGLWIGFSVLMFFISQGVPFLKFLNM